MSAQKKSRYPLVEVTWFDSSSDTGWKRSVESVRTPLTCWSAGYLVHKSERTIVVALNASCEDSQNSFGDVITIPRGCVQKIRRLR